MVTQWFETSYFGKRSLLLCKFWVDILCTKGPWGSWEKPLVILDYFPNFLLFYAHTSNCCSFHVNSFCSFHIWYWCLLLIVHVIVSVSGVIIGFFSSDFMSHQVLVWCHFDIIRIYTSIFVNVEWYYCGGQLPFVECFHWFGMKYFLIDKSRVCFLVISFILYDSIPIVLKAPVKLWFKNNN